MVPGPRDGGVTMHQWFARLWLAGLIFLSGMATGAVIERKGHPPPTSLTIAGSVLAVPHDGIDLTDACLIEVQDE